MSSRQKSSSAALLWVAGMIVTGLAAIAVFNTTRATTRDFDVLALEPAATRLPQWSGAAHISLLVLGIDERESQSGPWRTDTLIAVTIDPVALTAAGLSIPRDLWVNIPGLEQQGKINTAHFLGDVEEYPGGGPALAQATVQAALNVPMQYYVRVNFTAFEKLIDLIGGIDVDVPYPIDDPLYPDSGYGYEPLYIPAGRIHLDGRLALKYARTRHDVMGDFDRMQRQQQVIMAVRDKLTQGDLLVQLLTQAGPIFQTLGESIKTNLTLEQIVQLAQLGAQIDPGRIRLMTVTPEMVLALHVDTVPPQDALVLKPDVTQQLHAYLAGAGAAVATTPTPGATHIFSGTLQTYTVQMGDTLFSLSNRFGVSLDDLKAANGLLSDDIQAGQQLIIP
ncbi:MAG: LCP family protein [Chloroflexi bacterium]|nr:LCP family protein [Chloroflexota bacterium]